MAPKCLIVEAPRSTVLNKVREGLEQHFVHKHNNDRSFFNYLEALSACDAVGFVKLRQ